MNKITTLASGQINSSDSINVVLVRPDGMPPSVIIHWPEQPSVSAPLKFAEMASTVCKIVTRASTELARILGDRRGPRPRSQAALVPQLAGLGRSARCDRP